MYMYLILIVIVLLLLLVYMASDAMQNMQMHGKDFVNIRTMMDFPQHSWYICLLWNIMCFEGSL